MFLQQERNTLKKFFPGLDKKLLEFSLMEIECEDSPAIKIFREFRGPSLLIPVSYGGMGASLLQAIHIQRALGSRSPSLAVATTMHHISSVMIQDMITDESNSTLLEDVAKKNLYFSSGFAEGRTGSNILESCMNLKSTSDGFFVSGSKKPCTLSKSMDFMTVSIVVPKHQGESDEIALAVVDANTPGIEQHNFWQSWALLGTESNEVKLNHVYIPKENIFSMGDPNYLNPILIKTFSWFGLLASAAYLGIASALVERTILLTKGIDSERVALVTQLEGGMSALEGLAYSIINGDKSDSIVARGLFIRYLVQNIIERVTMHAAELLGGIAFIKSPEVAYLLSSARALAFHPPSRLSVTSNLDQYLLGKPLVI